MLPCRSPIVHLCPRDTFSPCVEWTAQQIVEAFPFGEAPRFVIVTGVRQGNQIQFPFLTHGLALRDVLLTSVSEGAPSPVADEGDNPDGGASPATAEPTDDAEPAAAVTDAFSFAPSPDFEFDECDALQPFIDAGKPVFNAEYADSFFGDANARAGMCADALASSFRTLVLPLDLDDSFRFSCDP